MKNRLKIKTKKLKLTTLAFTLIELLAIIVILAIIAVITVPIILNVIENSKKGAAKDSVYGYKDAINKYYVSELYENLDFKLDGTYTITDKGRLSNETGVHEIPFTGTIPTGGYLTYENNVLKTGCITMEEYKVNIEDGEITTVEKGKCDNEIVQLKVYATGEEVYYDPVTGEKCGIEDYHVDNSITGFNGIIEGENSTKTTDNQTQCLKWYAFLDEENSVTVDLLLDHNTTPGVSWNKESDCTLGPKDVIDELHSDTENWSEKLIRNDSHVEKWPGPGDGYTFTVDYNGKKARLISVDEIAHISGLNDWTQSDGNPNVPNEQNWLFDRSGNYCSNSGCPNSAVGDYTAGYWTVSPSYSSSGSWVVGHGHNRSVIAYFASYDAIGVRPVITINK